MNWWSETAVLWLPTAGHPHPEDFADRAAPGSSDFYYLALDAFDAIENRRGREFDREPWAYVLAEKRILSPTEIYDLLDEFRAQLRAESMTTVVRAST